jgi:hypothetical protein
MTAEELLIKMLCIEALLIILLWAWQDAEKRDGSKPSQLIGAEKVAGLEE